LTLGNDSGIISMLKSWEQFLPKKDFTAPLKFIMF